MPPGMPNPRLYLHETIHIIGTGSEPYKKHTAAWAARRQKGGAIVGIWQQSGSTGEWPRVVNLWEMEGWSHWAEILDKQYVYVIDKDDAFRQREVVIQNELDDVYVIKSGLAPEDRFVLEGVRQVHDGDKRECEFVKPEQVLANQKFHAE